MRLLYDLVVSDDLATYLLVLGDAKGITYVLTERRMAFTSNRPRGGTLTSGDKLLLYVAKGAYNHPGRDRGLVVGCATVASAVAPLDEPFRLGGRKFVSACDLRLTALAPRGSGAELKPLVEKLEAFPSPRTWSAYLRRPLLALPAPDVKVIEDALHQYLADDPEHVVADYIVTE